MSTIDHKGTAKATIRNLFAHHGAAGTLSLISEVLTESIPVRRGRPTRAEGVARLINSSIAGILPDVAHRESELEALLAAHRVEEESTI